MIQIFNSYSDFDCREDSKINGVSKEFAAMQIYHKSNPNVPVSPVRFYEANHKAMADIKRCAEEESKAS